MSRESGVWSQKSGAQPTAERHAQGETTQRTAPAFAKATAWQEEKPKTIKSFIFKERFPVLEQER